MEPVMFIKKLRDNMKMPKYAHGVEDSGMDLFISAIAIKENGYDTDVDEYDLAPGEVAICKTGFAIALSPGFEAQVRPTSGNSLKTMIRLPNSPGTIDAGYRGEVGVIVQNIGTTYINLKEGAKVAQMVICAVYHPEIIETTNLPSSQRLGAGYGSTGTIND